jgi:hypothetical protein
VLSRATGASASVDGNQSCSTPRLAGDHHQDESAECHACDTDGPASDSCGGRDREDEVGTLDPLGPLKVREG